MCLESPLARDWERRDQLEDSVAGPPGHIAEGFGRFNPLDFARFTVIARSSLMESQNHLRDAVDKNYISESMRLELDALAEAAIGEVTGLMEYLQSPEALRNARRARERRIASRQERRSKRKTLERATNSTNQEQRTSNSEPRTEPEPARLRAKRYGEVRRSLGEGGNTNREQRTEKIERHGSDSDSPVLPVSL
jgi:four helix bundle protein